jgi:O-antigen biosynthesis protein
MALAYKIWSPPYRHNCGGIKVLFKLNELLLKRGYDSRIVLDGEPIQNDELDYIAVYPEVVSGNPWVAKNVVRYILYFPGINGGQKEFDQNEVKFTFLKQYYNAPTLYINTIETELFNNKNLPEKKGVLYWQGKGQRILPNCEFTEITYQYPSTRKELAELLRKSEILYTSDTYTAVIEEALRCDCLVKINAPEITLHPYMLGLDDRLNEDLDFFIKTTQNKTLFY